MEFKIKFGALALLCTLGLMSLVEGQKLTMMPPHKEVQKFINDSYLVSCIAEGASQVEWYGPRNSKIESHSHGRIYQEASPVGVDLFFTRITTQDGGRYTCKQKHRAAPNVYFDLEPLLPITFNNDDSIQWANEGKSYTLRCRPQAGNEQATVMWRIDGRTPPAQSSKYKQLKDGLIIHNVNQDDARKDYTCRAVRYKPVPSYAVQNITMRVRTKPKIWTGSQLVHFGVVGDWANLTCRVVQAVPQAKFEWSKDNRALNPSDTTVILSPEENVSILQVLVRYDSMLGAYECKASNDLGQDIKRMTLKKAKRPPTPVLELYKSYANAAHIRIKHLPEKGNPNEKNVTPLPVNGIVVQHKMITKGDWRASNFSVSPDFKDFTIKDLVPEVKYNVRVALRNAAAQGEFSVNQFTIRPSKNDPISNAPASAVISSALFASVVALRVLFAALL